MLIIYGKNQTNGRSSPWVFLRKHCLDIISQVSKEFVTLQRRCQKRHLIVLVFLLEKPSRDKLWPAERKPSTSRNHWIWVRGDFIRIGRFSAKLRLLHQGVTGVLHCITLNYETRLCYYKDAISLNSQAGQWNTGMHCYGQLKHAFGKKAISQASSFLFVYRHNISPHFHPRCLIWRHYNLP